MTALSQELFGATFQNPVLLASGTCGYGREVADLLDLDALGGFVLKGTTPHAREGNPAPRVAEFADGMLNSVGLANVGAERCRDEKLPWVAANVRRAQVFVNVAGLAVDDFPQVVETLDPAPGFLGFELNVSCPNVRHGGGLIGANARSLAEVVGSCRSRTRRPLIVKMPPNVADLGELVAVAEAEGADGLTLVNTMPGLLYDLETRRPVLGAGSGGVSGAAILPVGVHAVRTARSRVDIPLIGAGGIRTARDALQYVLAGASLVQLGTASFADPRSAARVLSGLETHVRTAGVTFSELVGTGLNG
ncbi:MAG: dihydroorotate dehydrogenase [Gemmatimonadota bacterium]